MNTTFKPTLAQDKQAIIQKKIGSKQLTMKYSGDTGGIVNIPRFPGASRYYHPAYREAFGLECAAIKTVRDDMGLTNVKVMIAFCRTVAEERLSS